MKSILICESIHSFKYLYFELLAAGLYIVSHVENAPQCVPPVENTPQKSSPVENAPLPHNIHKNINVVKKKTINNIFDFFSEKKDYIFIAVNILLFPEYFILNTLQIHMYIYI